MSEMKRTLEAICDSYELEIRILDEAIQRVRDLHKPMILDGAPIGWEACVFCYGDDGSPWVYPCPTIRALDGEQ